MVRDQSSWSEWGQHVLAELERLNREIESLERRCSDCRDKSSVELRSMSVDIGALKATAAFWGVVGGAVAAAAPILIKLFHD